MALTTLNRALSSICQRRRRRVSGNSSGMHAKAVPINMPPPTPCNARPITSNSMSSATAQASDARVKIRVAASTNGLRP